MTARSMRARRPSIALVCWATAVGSSCASSGAYLTDRARDAADVLTLQVGYGVGAKARVGPVQAGLLADVGGVGLRGGAALGIRDFWPAGYDGPAKFEFDGLVVGVETFSGDTTSNERGKASMTLHALVTIPMGLLPFPASCRRELWEERMHIWSEPWPYYLAAEVAGGAGVTFRVGFNAGELVDFVVGWTTLDLFGDDLELDPPPPRWLAPAECHRTDQHAEDASPLEQPRSPPVGDPADGPAS